MVNHVEVVRQVLVADGSLVRSQNPALQQRCDSMDTGHQRGRGFLLPLEKRHPMPIPSALRWLVTKPTRRYGSRSRVRQFPPGRLSGRWPKHPEKSSCGCARCLPRLPVPRWQSRTHVRPAGLGRLPPGPPNRFRLPPPFLSAGHGPAAPSLAGTCAARSRPSCSCPSPTLAADPVHWRRSSGSPASTSPATSPPRVCACPERWCPRSPTSDAHRPGIA
jgi:hypothetical protein